MCPKHPTKRRYMSPEHAKSAARGIRRRGNPWIYEYECRHCGGFHLTSWPEGWSS